MNKIKYIKQAKCSGCAALSINENSITCKLGFKVAVVDIGGTASSPKPVDKCYKPLNEEELLQAQILNEKRLKREADKQA